MCGVAGIIDLKAKRGINRDALKRMTEALKHRGPDGEGFHIVPGAGFGHRRLAVIDPEGGVQPFNSHDGRSVLVFNGAIYNFRELACELTRRGAILSTRSDTEVLTEGLALYGPAFLGRLRGMFAFGYWNKADRALLLARDRLGEKPLYYATTADGFFLFASEIGAIAASGLIPLDYDETAIADYFYYGFVPDPKSIYRRIAKLPPAHVLSVRCGGEPVLNRYWTLSIEPSRSVGFGDSCESLRSLFDDAVHGQMIADVPLGAFLSGGVDSASIVASMATAGGDVTALTIGFDEKHHDERDAARLVARRFGAHHHEDVARIDATSLIDDIARACGEPFADSGALLAFLAARLARRTVTVALSGDGSDELFAGYRRHGLFQAEEHIRAALPLPLRKAVFGSAGAAFPKFDRAPRSFRLKTTLQALGENRGAAYARAMAINLPERAQSLISPDLTRMLDGYRPEIVVETVVETAPAHALDAALAADLAIWLPGRMLTKIDRASMAHGLETRAPFLDYRLVEWAARLDPAFRRQGRNNKRILKAAMAPRLPGETIKRKKQGFAPPLASWMRAKTGPLAPFLASRAWRESGMFDEQAVEAIAAQHFRGAADCSQELWTAIMFDAFLRSAGSPGPG